MISEPWFPSQVPAPVRPVPSREECAAKRAEGLAAECVECRSGNLPEPVQGGGWCHRIGTAGMRCPVRAVSSDLRETLVLTEQKLVLEQLRSHDLHEALAAMHRHWEKTGDKTYPPELRRQVTLALAMALRASVGVANSQERPA